MKKIRKEDDCLRQCIAKVMNLPPSKVPHFVKKYKGRWYWALVCWLTKKGWKCVLGHQSQKKHISVSPLLYSWIEIGKTKCGSSHAIVVGRLPGSKIESKVLYDGGHPLRLNRSGRFLLIFK